MGRRIIILAFALALVACGGASHAAGTVAPTATRSGRFPATADGVVQALKAAGVPIASVTTFTATTDPNHELGRPGGYTAKINWLDTRITQETSGIQGGGSVEVFCDANGAKARVDYITKLVNGLGGVVSEYDYQRGPIVLRVSGLLTPDQAKVYEQALAQVR